ncbi:MAG: response regulator transcription factor [Candidatus Omnitrophica bacterium]|nr:response regulator transcription factor [Candidatus Omnitrophota bacterium]
MRILVADDHELVRQGVRIVLEKQPGWCVCGEAKTGREAVAMAIELKPDLVVLDFSMPELNGLEATRQICDALPQTEVLVLTMHKSEQLMEAVLAAGARGYVLKSDAGKTLVQAVQNLCRHKAFYTSQMSAQSHGQPLHDEAANDRTAIHSCKLTRREREILQLITEGKSTKEAANALDISVKTAETHRTNIMRKLDLHSISDLVHYAIRNQIIQP